MRTKEEIILDNIRNAPYCVTFQQIMSQINISTEELSHVIASLTKDRTILLRADHTNSMEIREYAPRGKILYERFMDMLFETRPIKRSVGYYAEKLCVTSKYLSSVVKNYSHKTAYEMIKEITMDEMTYRLRYTEDSVKEIAIQLGFHTVSFFGKFFKASTGMSPLNYRKLYVADNKVSKSMD